MAWIENKKVMAKNINRLLNLKGKTRKEACADMGITYSTFTEWANGRKYPRIDKIEIMANYFNVEKSELIEDKTPAPHNDMYCGEEIGFLIKTKRLEQGLTQAQLGEKVGYSAGTVAKWENGNVSKLKRSTIQTMASILNISPLNLIGITVEQTDKEERKARQRILWQQRFGEVDFTDTEFTEIINYAQFVLSKRPTEKDK